MRCPASSLIGLAFLAACAAPPGGEEPRRRPAEYVVVAAHFEPRVEWEVKADNSYSARNGGAGGAVAGAAVGCVATGPLVAFCMAVVLPVAALTVGIVSGVQASRATSAGRRDAGGDYTGSGVREMVLSSLGSALDLQSRLEQAVTRAGWRVRPEARNAAGELRLEAGVERIKALSSAPIRNLWVHEMEVSWRLVDPADSDPVATGGFRHEKVLSFSLRYDEASGRWIGKDDGRFAAAWARACEEIAARIALEAVPAIAAHGR